VAGQINSQRSPQPHPTFVHLAVGGVRTCDLPVFVVVRIPVDIDMDHPPLYCHPSYLTRRAPCRWWDSNLGPTVVLGWVLLAARCTKHPTEHND